ncbi:hypothetical protein R3P38DRAFT_2793773 [Favolaschia claudopus]|uniref:Uncharacterized protein n=1 Tax=Favolaschia claudopus TaxID=2862362 RepID=A0AAW0ACC9_9AGAR
MTQDPRLTQKSTRRSQSKQAKQAAGSTDSSRETKVVQCGEMVCYSVIQAKNRRNSEQKTQASPVGETMMMVRVKEPPGKLYVLQPTVFYRWEGDRLPIYLLPINFDLCLKITLPWKGAKFVTRSAKNLDMFS